MKFTYSILIASFACLMVVSGCSSSSTSPATVILTAPKVGSSFTYMNVSRDTNNVVTHTDTSVQRILLANVAIGGMTDAILVEETQGSGTKDSNYVRFTSDGDVQLLNRNLNVSFLPQWLPIPFSTHATHSYKGDTTIANGLFTEYDTLTFAFKYERIENVTVKGSALSSSVASLTVTSHSKQTDIINTVYSSSTNSSEISFGTSIGWLTHQKDVIQVSDGRHQPTSEATLIDYSLAK